MQVFLVMNRKGGVGKTTIALHLAQELVKIDKLVLLLDADVDQADATYYSLGHDDFESGEIYGADYGFDVCWISEENEIPEDIDCYDCVVIDGRPSSVVGLRYVKDADVVVIPYNDVRARMQGKRFASLVNKANRDAKVFLVANGLKALDAEDYELPFDRWIRRKGWIGAKDSYKQKLNVFYSED